MEKVIDNYAERYGHRARNYAQEIMDGFDLVDQPRNVIKAMHEAYSDEETE